jgi:phage anti-repressor protein
MKYPIANIPFTEATIDGQTERAVDARELHTFLEVGRDFATWIKERIEAYGFEAQTDYIVCSPDLGSEGRGGQNRKDYALSMDMAKELAMVERNERGRLARRYFIECEKELRRRLQPDLSNAQQSDNMLVREAARLFGLKESELWVILRGDLGWLYHTNRRNVAYARTIAAGLMVHKIGHYTLPNGKIKETRTPVITPKGFRSLKAAMSERGYQLQGEQQTPAPAVERAPAPAKVADLPSVPARLLTDATAKMSWVHPTITVDLALQIDARVDGASDYALAMLSWVADARQAALA